jgi:hypothetical protein
LSSQAKGGEIMKKFLVILGVSLTGIFLQLFLFGFLFGQDIEIKTEDGIPVVYNPKEPVPLPDTPSQVTLIEDLRLGEPDEEQNYPFSMLSWLCVDDDENIVTMDNEEGCIRIFDKTGQLIRRFGRKGQGPGEFQSVSYLSVIEGDKICVVDRANHRLSHFTQDGKCLKEVKLGEYWDVYRIKADSQGFLYANFVMWKPTENEVGFTVDLMKFDPDFEPVMTMGSLEDSSRRREVIMIEKRFGYDVRSDDVLVWGINTEYVLNFVDPEGNVIRKVVKEYEPEKITEEDRKWHYKLQFGDRKLPPDVKFKYPRHYYPYAYLFCDDEGRIYVRTYQKTGQGEIYFDVFDSEGRYIARFTRPVSEMPSIVKKGKMYSILRDRNELPLLRRYRMVWE